jgi:hypothetical protein
MATLDILRCSGAGQPMSSNEQGMWEEDEFVDSAFHAEGNSRKYDEQSANGADESHVEQASTANPINHLDSVKVRLVVVVDSCVMSLCPSQTIRLM